MCVLLLLNMVLKSVVYCTHKTGLISPQFVLLQKLLFGGFLASAQLWQNLYQHDQSHNAKKKEFLFFMSGPFIADYTLYQFSSLSNVVSLTIIAFIPLNLMFGG